MRRVKRDVPAEVEEFLKRLRPVEDRKRMMTRARVVGEYQDDAARARRVPAPARDVRLALNRMFAGRLGSVMRRGERVYVVYALPEDPDTASAWEYRGHRAGRRRSPAWRRAAAMEEKFRRAFGITQQEASDRAARHPSLLCRALNRSPRLTSVQWVVEFSRLARIDRNKLIGLMVGDAVAPAKEGA